MAAFSNDKTILFNIVFNPLDIFDAGVFWIICFNFPLHCATDDINLPNKEFVLPTLANKPDALVTSPDFANCNAEFVFLTTWLPFPANINGFATTSPI